MIIQGLGGATSLYSTLNKSSVQRQELPTTTAKSADTVTISDAAKALAYSGSGATQPRTAIQERLLRSASSDTQSAEKIAYDMANVPSAIMYDIRDSLKSENIDDIKLSSTGRKIDDAFKKNFSKEAAEIDAKRLEIYNTEKAKGTHPVEIIAKMIDFTNAQSHDYLEATAWLNHDQ
ncbi:MAG: hypothetical protein REI09_12310 [Candidatus Dactylopiibacterium sp.]|nr:hypothetical protein [Candidatus Dactylopiibacterium sp.]